MEAGKPLAVLVYLALAPKNKAGRDHVAELLWPGCELHDARHSLRQTLYRLREATGGIPLVRAHGTELELLPAVTLDCLDGERHAADGQGGQAYELLRGNFLEGFSIPESVEFESWVEAARTRFRDSWARVAQRLVEEHLRSGDGAHALEMAEELAGLRPLSDEPARLVMTALAETNRHATAVARFRAYAELLKRELDTQPGQELEASCPPRGLVLEHHPLCHPQQYGIYAITAPFALGGGPTHEELCQILNPAGRPRFTRTRRAGSP